MVEFTDFLLWIFEKYYCVYSEDERQKLAETIEFLQGFTSND